MVNFIETEKQLMIADIAELERKLNFVFPVIYKEHLLRYNGGTCDPNVFYFSENGIKTSSVIDYFFAIYEGEFDNLEVYFNIYKKDNKRIPDSFFPIAHDPAGNLICMDSSDGVIYFWNHENEVDYKFESDISRRNLSYINENLSLFLENLDQTT